MKQEELQAVLAKRSTGHPRGYLPGHAIFGIRCIGLYATRPPRGSVERLERAREDVNPRRRGCQSDREGRRAWRAWRSDAKASKEALKL